VTAVSDTAALAAIGAAARELKLPTVRADAARLAEIAVRERQTHLAYLAEILAAEIDDRTSRRRARRIGEARFPRLKRLADFNADAIPGIAAQLAALASGAWIDAGQPLVLLGDSGTGKTHLLIGLGLAACEQGRRVRYATTAQLVNELAEAADSRQLSRVVARYGRLDLLLLDELGYVRLDPRGAELLFQIITERDEKASVGLATNLPFSKAHMFTRTCVRWHRSCTGSRAGGGLGGWISSGQGISEWPGQPDFFFLESQGGIEMAGCGIGYSGMQSEMAQSAVAGPGFGGRDECPPDAAADRVRGDCQLADVSVRLAGEVALLADGDDSCDTALIGGDQDRSLVAGSPGEGVGEPLPGCQDGGLVVPPGGNSLGQPRGELQDGILVTLGRGANLGACTIHVSSMSREPSYKKVHSGNWRQDACSRAGLFIYRGVFRRRGRRGRS
jgi:DNA replication protein DnaC